MGVKAGEVGVGWEEAGQARPGEEGLSWQRLEHRRHCLAWETQGGSVGQRQFWWEAEEKVRGSQGPALSCHLLHPSGLLVATQESHQQIDLPGLGVCLHF